MRAAAIEPVRVDLGREEALLLWRRIAAERRRSAEAALQAASVHVKAHERIHVAIAGPYAESAPRYSYAAGPDGRLYAVGGSVKVDLRPLPGDPEGTLRKAQALMRAAVGTGSPSAADLRVAAEAYRMAMAARREIEAERAGRFESPGSRVNVLA